MGDTLAATIITALAGLGGVVVGSLISWSVQARLLGQRIVADKELAEQKRSDELQLAERKFDYERDLHAHKRRAELAEQVLVDFYRFADLIREICSPGGFTGESDERPRVENETLAEASKLDAYYVPLARILKQSDFISGLRAKRYQSRALLGEPIGAAFDALNEAVWEIWSKAMMLTDAVRRGGAAFELHRDLMEQYEATIWQRTPGDDDPVEPTVKRAIEVAERVCRPILEQKNDAASLRT